MHCLFGTNPGRFQFSILDSWRRIGEGMLRGCEDWEMKGREWKGRLEMEME
jgi:hypothetical protein